MHTDVLVFRVEDFRDFINTSSNQRLISALEVQ